MFVQVNTISRESTSQKFVYKKKNGWKKLQEKTIQLKSEEYENREE